MLLIANKIAGENTDFGPNSSRAMFGEKLQFSLNGQQLIPYQGIDSEMKTQAFLSDTWGLRNQPQTSQMFQALGSAEINSLYSDYNRNLSYAGLSINAPIDELLLDYQRKAYTPKAVDIASIAKGTPNTTVVPKEPVYLDDIKFEVKGSETGEAGLNDTPLAPAAGSTPMSILIPFDSAAGNDYTADKGTITSVATGAVNASKQAFDMLFWGEVRKTMSVNDNRVTVAV